MAKDKLCFPKSADATAVDLPNNSRKYGFFAWTDVFVKGFSDPVQSTGAALQRLLLKFDVDLYKVIFIFHLKMRFQHHLLHFQ